MCKLYKIIYTCLHNKEVEIASCQVDQNPACCLLGIEIHDHHARWKCKNCRYYDYDRMRRGKAVMPLPVPPPPRVPSPNSSEDIEFEHMEDTSTDISSQIEHSENAGGVSTTARGTYHGSDSGRAARRAAGLRARFKSGSVWKTSIAEIPREHEAISWSVKSKSQSPGRGDTAAGTRDSIRERFGGFGGRRWRGDSNSVVPAVGGIPMEREATSRRFSGSSSMASYRGTDMEMGGEALGLEFGGAEMQREGSVGSGLGLDFGLGGMGRGEEMSSSDSDGGGVDLGLGLGLGVLGMERRGAGIPRIKFENADGTPSIRRPSDSASSTPADEGEAENESQESVTAQFLDGVDSSGPSRQESESSLISATVSGVDPEDDDGGDFHDSQESVTGQILAHF